MRLLHLRRPRPVQPWLVPLSASLPWYSTQAALTFRCPHGFVSTQGSPPWPCLRHECLQCARSHADAAATAILELPRCDDPVRWPREVRVDGIDGPSLREQCCRFPFVAVACHEHTGAFRNAWSEMGAPAASVAIRPSVAPPAITALSFVDTVEDWEAAYRHRIPFITANPDCHTAAVAAPNSAVARWRRHMASGALARAVDHMVWCLHVAELYHVEQPPTLMADVVGPPAERTTLAAFGCPRRKEWWRWQPVSLPVAAPSHSLPPTDLRSTHHDADHMDDERRRVSRTPTPPVFAGTHVAA